MRIAPSRASSLVKARLAKTNLIICIYTDADTVPLMWIVLARIDGQGFGGSDIGWNFSIQVVEMCSASSPASCMKLHRAGECVNRALKATPPQLDTNRHARFRVLWKFKPFSGAAHRCAEGRSMTKCSAQKPIPITLPCTPRFWMSSPSLPTTPFKPLARTRSVGRPVRKPVARIEFRMPRCHRVVGLRWGAWNAQQTQTTAHRCDSYDVIPLLSLHAIKPVQIQFVSPSTAHRPQPAPVSVCLVVCC